MFSRHFRIKDSNMGKVLTILKALRVCLSPYYQGLVVESDSSNGIYWMACLDLGPWKYQLLFRLQGNKIIIFLYEYGVSACGSFGQRHA